MKVPGVVALIACLVVSSGWADTTRFCLEGELDLGARYQGTAPRSGEFYSTRWCVVSDDDTERVMFSGSGRSNPDMDGDWTVAYLPPDLVRIVNRASPPDIEFHGTDNAGEARSVRRLDPHRLVSEFLEHPDRFSDMTLAHDDGRLTRLETAADLPLRGRVPVIWNWQWADPDRPTAELVVDGETLLRATGRWEVLGDTEAGDIWAATPGADPVEVPGDRWPARPRAHWYTPRQAARGSWNRRSTARTCRTTGSSRQCRRSISSRSPKP